MTELGRAGRDRWLLYQSSIGSPVYDILAARPERKLVNYHNITPAHLLRDWEPNVGYEVALGRTQLARLAPQSRLAVADSAFNESELRDLGYERHRRGAAAHRHAPEERRGRPRVDGRPGAPQGGDRRRRPSLRRQDLAAQGTARPRQDARRAAPSLRPGGPPAPGRLATGGDLRAGVARVHRRARARPTPSTSPGRSAAPSSRRTSRRPTSSSAPRTTRASACRWPRPWDTGSRSSPTASPRCPRRSRSAGLVLPDKSPLHFASAVARVLADPTLRRHLSASGLARAAEFSLPDSQRRFVSLVQEAIGSS